MDAGYPRALNSTIYDSNRLTIMSYQSNGHRSVLPSTGKVGSLNEGGSQDPRAFCYLVSNGVNSELTLPVTVPLALLRGPTV